MDHPTLLIGTDRGLLSLGLREERWFEGHGITALSVTAAAPWALLDRRTLWRSRGRGGWGQVASMNSGQARCLLAAGRRVLVGGAGARLMRLSSGAIRRVASFDRAPGRADWFTPWGAPADVRSMSQAPGGPLYVNVHVGGVLRSRDGGRTWQPTVEIESDVHQVLAHPARPGVVLAPSAVGLGLSRDGGETWSFLTQGFHAVYQRAVAAAGDVILVSTSQSERGREAAVYRRRLDDRGPFRKCRRGLPRWFAGNVDTHCLAARDRFAAIGTLDGAVFVSADRGLTWKLVREGLGRVTCVAFG